MPKKRSDFFEKVAQIIEQARRYVGRTADLTMCISYFEIGRMIVEQEQDGKARAEYGRRLMSELADFLTLRFGRGFSLTNLKNARKFYCLYSPKIQQSMIAKSKKRQSLISQLNNEEIPQKGQSLTAELNSPQKSYVADFPMAVIW